MDDATIKSLMITQAAVMAVFVIQKAFEWFIHFTRRKKEKDEDTLELLGKDINSLKVQIAALQAQLEMTVKHLVVVYKVEKDINALFQKMRKPEQD